MYSHDAATAASTPPYIVSPPRHTATTSRTERISSRWKYTYMRRAPMMAANTMTSDVS
jgi:hypothetical protein